MLGGDPAIMKEVYTKVGKQKLKLTNLGKVLYPTNGYTKAEVIQYYLKMAPIIFNYVNDRPLTTIRYPDGIHNEKFYSKSIPSWSPTWVARSAIQHDERTIDYVRVDQEATLVWLANLACLELHPMQFKMANNYCPDHVIFDLDPDENLGFDAVREATLELKDFLINYDFTPFVKTSGGKGFHVLAPIIPIMPYDQVTEGIKKLAAKFVKTNPSRFTLSISKQQRKGKILIDIYRNNLSNTTVAPYSLRGKKGAPISMPITWDQVTHVADAQIFNLSNYNSHLTEHGDLWQDWRRYEAPMYTGIAPHIEVKDNRLNQYEAQRDFTITSEPLPKSGGTGSSRFVLQLHNARNLHYDLRLEDNGVLISWAIPKGLPYASDQKRLAIRTEDHPMAYLHYEGVIPKGEYGAGQMWIVDVGSLEWQKKSATHFIFNINGKYLKHAYNLKRISEEGQWLISLEGEVPPIPEVVYKPMLAIQKKEVPLDSGLSYEVKWDGIRAIIYKDVNGVRIISRSGREITSAFPELLDTDYFEVEDVVIDGEIVVLDEEGRPLFHEVISRMHTKGDAQIRKMQASKPVAFYAFDLLRIDGIDITNRPLYLRREWLQVILNQDQFYRISESFTDGEMLFQAVKAKFMEGIIAKQLSSAYQEGERSVDWIKVKCRYQDEAYLIGYTKSEGERSNTFGALHLGKFDEVGTLTYMGKVGTGFNQANLKEIFNQLQRLPINAKLINASISDESNTTWVEPKLKCKIEYASLSSNGTYREPVFISLL